MSKNTKVQSSENEEVDVVIIGAGAAGLMSAHRLQQHDSSIRLVILEAKERIGGRVFAKNLKTAKGQEMFDMGAAWVGSSQQFVLDLMTELDIEKYPQYVDGENRAVLYDYSDITNYTGLLPKLGKPNSANVIELLAEIELLVKTISLENPLENKYVYDWDSQTVETFLKHSGIGPFFADTKSLFDVALKCVFGADSSQISFYFLLYYSALAGGLINLLSTGNKGSQQYRVEGTMYGMLQKLQDKIGKDKVILGDPVVAIQQIADKTSTLVSTLKGIQYRAKYVVCALPPHLVNKIQFNPPLPFSRQQLNQRMPIGNQIKCMAVYKKPFWRKNNLSGQSVMMFEPHAKNTISATFDYTSSKGTPALLGFIGGEQAYYWNQQPPEKRKEAVLKYFSQVFGKKSETELVTYEDTDWAQVDYNGGCPVGVMQPGCAVYFEPALREPFGRIHFAGTETARQWMGYVDGAVESGVRVAEEIAERMKNPDQLFMNKISLTSPVFDQKEPTQKDCNII